MNKYGVIPVNILMCSLFALMQDIFQRNVTHTSKLDTPLQFDSFPTGAELLTRLFERRYK